MTQNSFERNSGAVPESIPGGDVSPRPSFLVRCLTWLARASRAPEVGRAAASGRGAGAPSRALLVAALLGFGVSFAPLATAQDLDADGIVDLDDLDDDNDGILDTVEGLERLPGNLVAGKVFYGLAFPPNAGDTVDPFTQRSINIAGDPGTAVTVDGVDDVIPASGLLTVSTSKTLTAPGLDSANTISVVADAPITVTLVSYHLYSSDAWVALPANSLGSLYTTIGFTNGAGTRPSQILVGGAEDGTSVTISDTSGSVVASFSLDSSQSYLYQADPAATDLTGYTVTADKPVSQRNGSGTVATTT